MRKLCNPYRRWLSLDLGVQHSSHTHCIIADQLNPALAELLPRAASRPASAASFGSRRAASPPPPSGSKPWYAKLFTPHPEAGSSRHSPATGQDSATQCLPAPQHDAAGQLGEAAPVATAEQPPGSAGPVEVGISHAGTPMRAAADLGSALEAFMDSSDDDDPQQGAAPDAAALQQANGTLADERQPTTAALAAPASSPPAPVPQRSNGYAALADGYLGASGSTWGAAGPTYAAGSLGQGAQPESSSAAMHAGLAPAAGGPTAAVAPKLGRPASFQASC